MGKIVLLRHGESIWNQQNLFTGWTDVPLSLKGMEEARHAARLIKQTGIEIDAAFTSVLNRAVYSLWLVMETLDRLWLPVNKSWRLNERHYGALQGMNKDEAAHRFGEKLVYHWRRSYHGIPPPLTGDPRRLHQEPRYRHIALSDLPGGESLEMTQRRVLPYWQHAIAPRVISGESILLVGHANMLRALTMFLEKTDENEIVDLTIPTGIPVLYEMNGSNIIGGRSALI
ncbi:2,3-bisphosphoglycerate-dependent phosphoglycerate mutase [Klebsiella variicola]|uniref:2,3-bisphosphoglycerate-dependent phosphoglycerate mutase n=1 Tax=Klebsiella variicola TaxID=244366 RepID=UPI0023F7E1A7|nr:2,3-bisphosphoglycerate-dependent phosphoglycerate mutase [Klebsiella variicola]MDF7652983.1 2,3-bisphosphoglycerate-dependent phosphoglycerate mutase [Klebsiella variicola]